MTPTDTLQDPVSDTAPVTGWWRRNVWWLLGTAVLGAWTTYGAYRDELKRYEYRHPAHAIEVAKGQWGDYAGARWRLLSAEALAPKDPRLNFNLRRDGGVLVLRFEVIPQPGTESKVLDRCRGRVSDAKGRLWDANPTDLSRLRSAVPRTCGSGYGAGFKAIEAKPGQPFQFEHVYLLPRVGKLDGLRAQIAIQPESADKPESGRFLSFAF